MIVRGWVGSFINDGYIPRQYRTYLSGGVDPNFNSTFVFNRMRLNDNTYPAIYDRQYIQDGPGLRGLAMSGTRALYSNETNWGINLTQSFTNIPVEFFADFVGATDLLDNYIDFGLTFDLGIVKIYLPVYQNWDEQSTISDFDWIKERIRFEIDIPMPNIGT